MARAARKKKEKVEIISFNGTGRRKDSIARVRLIPGTGKITVNGKDLSEHFSGNRFLSQTAESPLIATNTKEKFDVIVKVIGGGTTGQAGAIRHGIARALEDADETLREPLKKAGFLTRDSRMKERRKYGLKKARKAPQFSKR